jgi:hypothetical protein
MRFLSMILLLSAVVACGNNGGSGSGSSGPQAQQCEVDGQVVSCDSIYDGLGVDILDAMVDAPATVTSSAITFTQSRNTKVQGRRIACSASVNSGDVYRYSIHGNTLTLDTPTGNLDMTRIQGDSGIVGKWKWVGIVDGATYETKVLTVVKSLNRVLMKTTCER